MEEYNNEAYKDLVNTVISDAFYTDGLSYDAKISLIRRYTEIILRRLLRFQSDMKLTVGSKEISEKLKEYGYTESFFRSALETIVKPGNVRTHTQELQVAGEEEYQTVLQALLELYGYMFYKFFKKYEFGSNASIVTSFSILPPIIRYITLSHLFEEDKNNYLLADKLLLATLKSFGVKKAKEWLDSRGGELRKINTSMSAEDEKKLINKVGCEIACEVFKITESKTAYDNFNEKLTLLEEYKPLYTTFEEAVSYYKENGIVEGESEDIKEFNDLMEFVYMGRREAEKDLKGENSVLENVASYLSYNKEKLNR